MDRYTKTVLTVIAACLVIIAFRDVSIVSEVSADDPRSKRYIKRVIEDCSVYVYDISGGEGYGRINCY